MISISEALFTYITDIGDSASLLAITLAGSIYLLIRQSSRAAAFMASAFLLTILLTGLIKLFSIGCRHYFHIQTIHSPSGHAALACATLGAYAVAMHHQLAGRNRFLPSILLIPLILLIALSRTWLDFHTIPEVAIGLAAGGISLLIAYIILFRDKSIRPFDAYALGFWGILAAFLTHGIRLPAESLIHFIVFHIHSDIGLCVK